MPYKPGKPGGPRSGGKPRPGGRPTDRGEGRPRRFDRDDERGGERPRGGDDRPRRSFNRDNEGRGPRPERGGRPPYRREDGDRPAYRREDGDRPPYRREGGDRPQRFERGDRPRGERPPYRRDGGDRPQRFERGDRPDRGDRPPYRRPDGERPGYSERGDRPERQDRGDRPPYRREEGGRPPYRRDEGDRPRRFDRGDRPQRSERSGPPRREYSQGRPDRGYRDDNRQGGYIRRSAPKNQLPEALIYGINPVSVALQQGRLRKLFIDNDASNPRLLDILEIADAAGIEHQTLESQGWGDALSRDMHQGVAGLLSGRSFQSIEELVGKLDANADSTILFLDKIQDPHNLGAVLRTAAATGVDAVVLPKSGGCGLTPAVHKASAGMSLVVNVIEDVNFAQALAFLKQQGYWVVGCDSGGGEDATSFAFPKRRVLVMGSEGSGIRRLVRESCDHLVKLPMAEGVESLNISVATGVILYMAQASSARGEEAEPREVESDPADSPGLGVDPALIDEELAAGLEEE